MSTENPSLSFFSYLLFKSIKDQETIVSETNVMDVLLNGRV